MGVKVAPSQPSGFASTAAHRGGQAEMEDVLGVLRECRCVGERPHLVAVGRSTSAVCDRGGRELGSVVLNIPADGLVERHSNWVVEG